MALPSNITKNPKNPPWKSPSSPNTQCGWNWGNKITIQQGGEKKELQALAHPEIAIPGSYGPMSSWLSGNAIFDVHFSRISGNIDNFIERGYIDAKNRKIITTALDRSSKYYQEGVALFAHAELPTVDESHRKEYNEHAQKLIIVALANLRCAQEAAWALGLYGRGKSTVTGSLAPRRGPRPSLDEAAGRGPADSGATRKKKGGKGLLLVGVAAVGILVLSKK